jgi:hypothetical protein
LKSFKELAVGPVTCQTDRFFASYLKRLAGSLKLFQKKFKELVKEPTLNASSLIF